MKAHPIRTKAFDAQFMWASVVFLALSALYAVWGFVVAGPSFAHLYWVAFAAFAVFLVERVNQFVRKMRKYEFDQDVEEWVKNGDPDKPLRAD